MQLLYTKRKCRNHGFLLAFFGDFLSLLKESHPPEAIEEKTTGKICRRRHVTYANVLLAESHPPEAIEEKTTGKICRRRQKEKRLRGKDTTGERSTKFRKKGLTFLSYLL